MFYNIYKCCKYRLNVRIFTSVKETIITLLKNDMTTTTEIFNSIFAHTTTLCSSLYMLTQNDTSIIRIANHLPKDYNLNQNEECEKFLFLFTSDLNKTEQEIEKHLESISFLENKEYDYLVIEDETTLSTFSHIVKYYM